MRHPVSTSVLLFAIAGCGGGSGGGVSADGGYVRVEHVLSPSGADVTTARAELGRDLPSQRPDTGCGAPVSDSDAGGTWLDAGPTIAIVEDATATTIELDRASIGSRVLYGADGVTGAASFPGARYDVVLAGSDDVAADTWAGAVQIPQPVEPLDFVNQIGFLVEQVIEWSPSDDADEVIVEFGTGSEVTLVCRVSGSRTTLTLSEEENRSLEASGGTITFRAIRRGTQSLDGHGVATEGQNVVVVTYQ